MRRTDLDGEEVTDERHKHHLLTVPHLFGVDLDSAAELPPLTTVLHEDLNAHRKHALRSYYKIMFIYLFDSY